MFNQFSCIKAFAIDFVWHYHEGLHRMHDCPSFYLPSVWLADRWRQELPDHQSLVRARHILRSSAPVCARTALSRPSHSQANCRQLIRPVRPSSTEHDSLKFSRGFAEP
jgi:hypothetical protein